MSSNPRNEVGNLLGRELSTAVVLFHEAIAERLGMSATEWKCLDALGRAGPITARELAHQTGLTTGAITGLVDRLEGAGYVRRVPNPTDRRSVIIQPVRRPDLEAELAPIFGSLSHAMEEILGRYDAREMAAIQDFFNQTVRILREETARLQTRASDRSPT